MKIEGIIVPVVTLFTKDEEIDEKRFVRYLDFLIEKKVHGLYLLGTNGEGPLLTFKEKKRIIKIAVEHVNARVPVIAGTGCVSTKETIELSKYAEKVGVDGIGVVTPYYYPVTPQGLIKHYKSIAENVELPILIYYIPDRTGNKMDIDTLIRLTEFKNIIGIKDSSKDVTWFYHAINAVKMRRNDFSFFGGSDALIYTHLSLGGNGTISAVANVFPEIVIELYEEFRKGHHEKAKEIQDKILKIRQALKQGPYMAGVKGALKLRGIDSSDPRCPLQSLDKTELKKLEKNLKMIGVL